LYFATSNLFLKFGNIFKEEIVNYFKMGIEGLVVLLFFTIMVFVTHKIHMDFIRKNYVIAILYTIINIAVLYMGYVMFRFVQTY
jgi:hypothetical protein